MDIRARHISGTPEELDNLPAAIEDAQQTTLLWHEQHHSEPWARSQRAHTITLAELHHELRAVIEAAKTEDSGLDYFSAMYTYDQSTHTSIIDARKFPTLTPETKLESIRYRWIAVYAVEGSSEGHYVHVDVLWADGYHQEGRVPLFLAKTFGGQAEGIKLAGLLTRAMGV